MNSALTALILVVLVGSLACSGEPTPTRPRYLPFNEAQAIVPFPIQVPGYIPEGYALDEEAYILEGRNYGYEVKGARIDLDAEASGDVNAVRVRQFVAEGTSAPTRAYLEGIISFETIALGDSVAEVKEIETGGIPKTVIEWEAEHEGKRIFMSVDSDAGREETLRMVRSLGPLRDE